jgi:hypothetical protein
MWTVIKIKINELNLLKQDLDKKLNSDYKIYAPKILFTSYTNKKKPKAKQMYLLGDYIFCFSNKFKEQKYLEIIKFSRGIKSIISSFKSSQNEISNFIQRCRCYEIKKDIISLNFFDVEQDKSYQFNSGIFTNHLFKVVKVQKEKIKILMGNLNIFFNKEKYLLSINN